MVHIGIDRAKHRDVFLSHASVDKEHYVEPVAKCLGDRDITYWLDEAEIPWGHSLITTISKGLESSRFVLFFLSDGFFARPWPDAELRAALAKEIAAGELRVLPLLICEPERAFQQYAFLRDKRFIKWGQGIENIVAELENVLGRPFRTSWEFRFPAEFRGHVWLRVIPRMEHIGKAHKYRLSWGRYVREGVTRNLDAGGIILACRKIAERETYPLACEISPAAFLSGGHGRLVEDINKGWVCRDRHGRTMARLAKWVQWILPDSDASGIAGDKDV